MKNIPPPLLAAVLSAFLPAAPAAAETLYMTASDASGKSSFTTWDASGKALGAPSASNDYVDEGYNIRAPSAYDAVFNGKSLTLGSYSKNKNGVLIGYNRATQKLTFANDGLFLEQGRLTSWAGGREYTYAGTITVKSPLGNPFIIEIADAPNHLGNTNILTATVKGAKDTEFAIANNAANPTGYAILSPSANTTFEGTLTIGKVDYGLNSRQHPVRAEYRGSITWPGTIRVRGNSELLAQYSSTKWTIGTLDLDANATLLTKLANDATSTITLANKLSTTYPVYLTTPAARTGTGNTAASSKWSVLTLPIDKGDLGDNVGDFVLAKQPTLFPETLPAVYLSVSTNGTVASLDLVQRQIVRLTDSATPAINVGSDGFYTATTNAAAWSDKALPHPDADYVVDGESYVFNVAPASLLGDDGVYEFPGSSLTIGNSNNKQVDFYNAATTLRLPLLRMSNNARFWPLSSLGGPSVRTVEGDGIYLVGSGVAQSYVRIYGGATVVLKTPLLGTGRLTIFNNASSSRPNATLVLAGDNSDFAGRIRFSGGVKDGSDNYANTIVVDNASQLGGPLDTFTYDALEFAVGSTLSVANDVDFSTANRGMYVRDSGVVSVGGGATLTLGNAVSFGANATLRKTGGGTLAFGAAPLQKDGSVALAGSGQAATLSVEDGFVQALATDALAGLSLIFTDRAYLLVDPEAQGDVASLGVVDLGANPFGGELPVAFKLPDLVGDAQYSYNNIAVATVANKAAAQALTLSAKKIKEHAVQFSTRENDDGTATILARIIRPGITLIVR